MMMGRSASTIVAAGVVGAWGAVVAAQTPVIAPSVETVAVPSAGDAADDAAIWLHPTDPALSLVIGTDKAGGGLAVYELDGSQRQIIGPGRPNNTDVRYNFRLGGGLVDLVGAGN